MSPRARHRIKMVISPDGTREWFRNGLWHRDDGPAVEWPNGTKVWFYNGRRHRDDGPAVEHADGSTEWWKQGLHVASCPAQEAIAPVDIVRRPRNRSVN